MSEEMDELDGVTVRDILPPGEGMKKEDFVPPIQASPFDETGTKPEVFKYYRCKHGEYNIVRPEDLFPVKDLAKEPGRKETVHAELNHELAVKFKKLSKNFGNYNATIAVLIDNWNKHNR